MDSKMAPETHPNYRPPVDMPIIALGSPKPARKNEISCGGFVASDLLSASECAQLIAAAEKHNPTKVDWEYSPDYRDCNRVVLRSSLLAEALYKRLLPLLTTDECESVRPFGFDGIGSWRPRKLNQVVRVSRYDVGGHFQPHRDGAFVENDDLRSVYTVLVYLNQAPAFGGGNTAIHLDSETKIIEPVTGSALIMTHDTLHSGEAVTSGHKYIARFDLMFHRLGGGMTEAELAQLPDRQLAERLYASSITKQRNGDPKGSTEDYVQALKIQAKLPSSSPAPLYPENTILDNLGKDNFLLCLRFLCLQDIANASAVCRSWHAACSSGILWRELFVFRWAALSCAESSVADETPLAVSLPLNRSDGRDVPVHRVYATVLEQKPELWPRNDSQAFLKEQLYGNRVPNGYMFSSLPLSKFTLVDRCRYGWKMFHVAVRDGAIHFMEYNPNVERAWMSRYDASSDIDLDVPPPIRLDADADISFAIRHLNAKNVDACIVKLPGTEQNLALCSDDPRIKNRYWHYSFAGVLQDIGRVLVAHQTERALRFGDPVIRCDAKTKQWKTAYMRRHTAERFFDTVSIDIGSKFTKFASQATTNDSLTPRGTDSGSFPSLVCRHRGHLWSAGHGLENHKVGESCLDRTDDATRPFNDIGIPDCHTMGIICAHVVERSPAVRPNRQRFCIRQTCAEHPINMVESALGLTEEVRQQLTLKLASWNVPFVGFVNGAVAALSYGDKPKKNGIVAMLGGANSAVVRVTDGVADVANGVQLHVEGDTDPRLVAKEVLSATAEVQKSSIRSLPVLLTGGGATDSIVASIKCHIPGAYGASPECERHLDAVQGAHILANLSDGRKHFRCVLNLMWGTQVGTH